MKKNYPEIAKNTIEKVQLARYQYIQKKLAAEALRTIESQNGKTPSAMLRQAKEYAKEVLGWKGYAPWLKVYTAMAGSFKEGWIPDSYYRQVVAPAWQAGYGGSSHLKGFHNRLFNSSAFPDIAYVVNGLLLSGNYEVLSPGDLEEMLFNKREEVVFKLDHSFQGSGVYFIGRNNFSLDKTRAMGNGVFQEAIRQHTDLAAMMPLSVATLRLTTVYGDNGEVSLRAAYLRVGRSSERHVMSGSHIRIPIDLKTGQLSEKGYLPSWERIQMHPESRLFFGQVRIPAYEKCVETVRQLHGKMPLSRCIGWDITVDAKEEVKVMEWNGSNNDVKFSEATQGPCFTGLGWERLWKANKKKF